MISDAAPTPASDRKEPARAFLRKADKEFRAHRENRGRLARAARSFGLTNQDIADQYGITEAAVRSLVKRAAK